MDREKEAIATQDQAFLKEVLSDYELACTSREASLLGRKEVLTGKAKFGIFGDGKELAQIAMAKQFKNGDFRSGYYRDQTFMMAIGSLSVQQMFAALYAHTDLLQEPASAGRQMGGHFSTRSLNDDGSWRNLMEQKNSSADISPTAGQMPRLVGLAQASKIYRNLNNLSAKFSKFTDGGDEVAFGTIGDASTSEGLFFESMNAAGVLQVPMVISVWDDGYRISVPKKYQTTGGSISRLLKGFQQEPGIEGYEIYTVKGWDYANLVATYEKAVALSRKDHVPALIHVEEMTQPQGHSTSGSHERYKSKEQLAWAEEHDCIIKMREWILNHDLAEVEALDRIEQEAKKGVRTAQKAAWKEFLEPLSAERDTVVDLIKKVESIDDSLPTLAEKLHKEVNPIRRDIFSAARKALRIISRKDAAAGEFLKTWIDAESAKNTERYSGYLYSGRSEQINQTVDAQYSDDSEDVDGRIILRDNFDALFSKYPELLTFGEDVGKIGGVNQSMEGMQEKFGKLRVADTGIREASILGQGIGMAMRGLRPIAEIQYLDYIFYALQIMSDDLATLHYRSYGGQRSPVIIRTRGHRLEGIWHAGSPMGAIINSIRGIYVCVPRNMMTAAGFYNTLLESDNPALVVEPLNGYRTKEKKPTNLGEFKIPLGVPEIVKEGSDITIVSYGATLNLVMDSIQELTSFGIDVEVVDVRTLLPFDTGHLISKSIKKTNRLLIVDEDVPGGASAFILDKVLNEQGAYRLLDSEPITLTAKAHRPAYGSDGDYFSKPSVDDIVETTYGLLAESDPGKFKPLN